VLHFGQSRRSDCRRPRVGGLHTGRCNLELSLQILERLQNQEEWPTRDKGPTTAKKRRTELEPEISIEEDVFLQKVENVQLPLRSSRLCI
jgi:lipoate-protein ligase A